MTGLYVCGGCLLALEIITIIWLQYQRLGELSRSRDYWYESSCKWMEAALKLMDREAEKTSWDK